MSCQSGEICLAQLSVRNFQNQVLYFRSRLLQLRWIWTEIQFNRILVLQSAPAESAHLFSCIDVYNIKPQASHCCLFLEKSLENMDFEAGKGSKENCINYTQYIFFPAYMYSSKKIGISPRVGIELPFPCILVRRANHYTIRDYHTGNAADY